MTFGLDLAKDHELALVYDGHSFVWRYLSLRNIESVLTFNINNENSRGDSHWDLVMIIQFKLLKKYKIEPCDDTPGEFKNLDC